jgi:hypothetical protein
MYPLHECTRERREGVQSTDQQRRSLIFVNYCISFLKEISTFK